MNNRESQRIKTHVMFVEYGNPINAIKKNEFSIKWNNSGIGAKLIVGD